MFPKRMFNPVFCDYAFESAFLSFVILMNFCIQCQYRFVPSKSTVSLKARAVVCRVVNVKVGGKCLYVRHLPPTQYRDRPKFLIVYFFK